MYYWTSGAFLNAGDADNHNIFWCSTNVTSDVSISPNRSESSKKCVAFERWTGTFRELNCSKRLSFICEVKIYCYLRSYCTRLFYISEFLPKRSLSSKGPVRQKRLKIVLFRLKSFSYKYFRQLYFTRLEAKSTLIVMTVISNLTIEANHYF
jgi:hypothetical protein